MTIVSFPLEQPVMRTIKASEFKAKCLALLNEVAATGEPIVITKHGRPVAQLVARPDLPEQIIGRGRTVLSIRDPDDDLTDLLTSDDVASWYGHRSIDRAAGARRPAVRGP